MKARMSALASFLIGPMLTAMPLAAQFPGFSLELRAGYSGSRTELGSTAVLDQLGYVKFDEREPGGFAGAAGLIQLNELWGLRVSLDYAPDTDVQGTWYCAPFVACLDVLIKPQARLRRWALGADVRMSPSIDLGPIRPVVFVGAGARKQELRWSPPPADVSIPLQFDETDGFVRGGLGLSGAIGRLELFGEADGTVGPFGSPEQQYIEGLIPDGRNRNFDLGIAVGARVHVR